MLHILVGTNTDDLDAFNNLAAAKQRAMQWVVPKDAAVGHDVVFYFGSTGFYARGRVATEPVKGIFQSGPNKRPRNVLRSDIAGIELLENPLARSVVAEEVPEWGWARMRFPVPTTPPDEVAAKLVHLIEHSGDDGDSADTDDDDSQLTTPQAEDLEPPAAERVETTVSRILRDTRLSNRVKALHNYECQLCGSTLLLADGSRYAEGHHILPLGSPHNGPDVLGNIICLCPNHHAACDLGAIELVRNELRGAVGHVVAQRYIDYHNSIIYRGSNRAEQVATADRPRE